jgi:hypothetical protein
MIAITWGPAEQPYAPSNLTVVDITEIDFGLTWTDNSNLETQLILQVQRYEDDYVANEWDYTIAANEVSLSNINVYNGQTNPLFIQANTHYKARLAAVNGPAGDVFSDWVEVDFWTSSGDQSKGFFRLLG